MKPEIFCKAKHLLCFLVEVLNCDDAQFGKASDEVPIFTQNYISDRPEIDQEETFVHTREGDQTEVICVVHSSPKANVTWYKNGEPLDTRQHQISQIGNRHTLSLPITTKEAFGQYTCRASNTYGTSQKTTEVSGLSMFFYITEVSRFGTKNVPNVR